jgi:hypothetical protein
LTQEANNAPPLPALALTLAGLIPFVAPALVMILSPDDPVRRAQAGLALVVYAAVILSFLGGVRWGAEIAAGRAGWAGLGLSVLGALAGWGAVLYGVLGALSVPVFIALAAALLLHGLWDARAASGLPVWYRRLRIAATAGAVLALGVGAWAQALR